MITSRRKSLACAALAVALAICQAAPALAAEGKKKQSDQARRAIDQQAAIAKAMADKANNSPTELQKQLDALKAELAAETKRHNDTLAPLQKELAALAGGRDKSRANRTQKQIDKENETFNARTADLNKRIADLQARLDASKAR